MKNRVKHHHRTADRAGFTMVECLIGLAISAMLMTALAVAFNASIVNFQENEAMFESVNNARQALTRMTSELRTAGYSDPSSGDWLGVMWQASPSSQCEFWTRRSDGDHHIIYEYRDASDPNDPNTLMLIQDGTPYRLCDDVMAASFSMTQAEHPNEMDAKSVLISLTVQTGHVERTLSAAAVVRRSLTL